MFVMFPVMELLGGVQVISVVCILGDVDQVFSLEIYIIVAVLQFVHPEIIKEKMKNFHFSIIRDSYVTDLLSVRFSSNEIFWCAYLKSAALI